LAATELSPAELLRACKSVEGALGRPAPGSSGYVQNGPRTLDIDIVLYGDDPRMDWTVERGDMGNGVDLEVPHPRFRGREFVLAPLSDLLGGGFLTGGRTLHEMRAALPEGDRAAVVVPLPRDRVLRMDRSVVMGILNATPDSFSDGGLGLDRDIEVAVASALRMVEEGADIIDIGGESTRPGAREVHPDEEMRRTVPLIEALRRVSDVPISIDTRHAACARAAVGAGADLINDVSGGTFDPHMLPAAAEVAVPVCLMHMRGTPETMASLQGYDDVVAEVGEGLCALARQAESAGVPRWAQVLDPGIGFAKDAEGSLALVRHADRIQRLCDGAPLLLGPSRKGFLRAITGEENPVERDFGTAAACAAAATYRGTGPCHIYRVHNVRGVRQALMVADALSGVK